MTSPNLLLVFSIFGSTILCIQAEETTLRNSSGLETTTGVLPSAGTSPTNFTVQCTKEITFDRETSTTTITTDEIAETSSKKTTTFTHITEPSTAGTSTEIITSNFTRYTTQSTTVIYNAFENLTSDPTPQLISSQVTSTRNTSASKNSTKAEIQEMCKGTENVTYDSTPNIICSLPTITINISTPKNSTEVVVQEITAVNQTSLTSGSTLAIPQTQNLIANMTSTVAGSSTKPISIQHISGLTPAPESTSRNTLKANETMRIKTTRKTANTTLSKKKQKALQKKTPKPTSTLPTIKPDSTHYSHTYSLYKWTFVTGRTMLFTKEIDYRESNEFGEESYKKFMFRTGIYVDKSLLIKEFLDHASQVILITRPRLWGKSLNLNMIRKFFEIEVDEGGKILPREQQTNRNIFCGGDINNGSATKSFPALKIANIPEAMEHQGKHPVIQLNYHFILNGNYEDVEIGMKIQIIKSYKRHFYLDSYFKSNLHLLDDQQRSEFQRYSNGNLTTQDLIHSIRFMSELLYKYFNQSVFVLIDEYDTPLVEAFRQSSEKPETLDKILRFYRLLYTNAFVDNPFLAKGFITGKLRIANSNLFVNLTNISEYTVLDHQFNQFYGFTEQEVDELLEPMPSIHIRDEIKSYYRGYNYGGQIMFNPWSIKICIERNYEIGLYWLGTGFLYPGSRKKYSLEGVQQDVKSLLSGRCIQVPIKNEVTFEGLQYGKNFFNFILFTGYLSPVMKNPNGTYQLVKPNIEANSFFSFILGAWVQQHFNRSARVSVVPTDNRRNYTLGQLSGSSDKPRKDGKSTPWSTTPIQSSEFSFSQRSINLTSNIPNECTDVPDVNPVAMTSQTSSNTNTWT